MAIESQFSCRARVYLIARGSRDHIADHFRNDDPLGRHDLLHRNAFPDGNNSAGFAECLPGCSDERVNRQSLIQQIRQDGLPAPHGRPALPRPQWSSAGGGWKCVGLALRLADPRRRSVLWEVAAGA
jgi:hypothetical protein